MKPMKYHRRWRDRQENAIEQELNLLLVEPFVSLTRELKLPAEMSDYQVNWQRVGWTRTLVLRAGAMAAILTITGHAYAISDLGAVVHFDPTKGSIYPMVSKFANWIHDCALTIKARTSTSKPEPIQQPAPPAKRKKRLAEPAAAETEDPREADLKSALRNLGFGPRECDVRCAHAMARAKPDIALPELIKLSLTSSM